MSNYQFLLIFALLLSINGNVTDSKLSSFFFFVAGLICFIYGGIEWLRSMDR